MFGRRGAIQEQLTSAIHNAVSKITEGNKGVIVTIVGTHNCVSCRGVKHNGASMVTTKASGVFRENNNLARKEFSASDLKKYAEKKEKVLETLEKYQNDCRKGEYKVIYRFNEEVLEGLDDIKISDEGIELKGFPHPIKFN